MGFFGSLAKQAGRDFLASLERRSGELSRDSRIPEDKREKFADMHDRLKEQRERNRH